MPNNPRKKIDVRRRAPRFIYFNDVLYRRSFDGVLLRCLGDEEADQAIEEAHSSICGAHQSGQKLHFQIKRMGYYWPTMVRDCIDYAQRCQTCQFHANLIHQPPESLHPTVSSWPFDAWGLDVVGPLTKSGGHLYILAATDYFPKWAEAVPLKEVKKENVADFILGLEFIFEVMDCPDRYRIVCAQLHLTGDARLWWNAYWSMRPGEKAGCTWDMLKELVREKYYPTYYRAEMERQFLSLQQGTRTVDEYEREFTRLAAFVPDLVRTEAQRAQRFIDGLYPAVRHNIVGHGTQTYARAVSIAQEVDASIRREAVRDRAQPSAPVQPFTAPPALPAAQPAKEKKRKGKGAQTDRRTRQRQQQ
ncbi:Unknown protein, partial [Striga hermonthica]